MLGTWQGAGLSFQATAQAWITSQYIVWLTTVQGMLLAGKRQGRGAGDLGSSVVVVIALVVVISVVLVVVMITVVVLV